MQDEPESQLGFDHRGQSDGAQMLMFTQADAGQIDMEPVEAQVRFPALKWAQNSFGPGRPSRKE